MTAVRENGFLNARVSVFRSRLLNSETLQAAVQGDESDLRAALAEALGDAEPIWQIDDPAVLEHALASVVIDEAERLARAAQGPAREMLHHWMRRFGLINIKLILRGKMAGLTPEAISEGLVTLGTPTALPEEAMIQAHDAADLLRQLENSSYAEMAHWALRRYQERRDLFTVEAALDRQFFAGLARRSNALPRAERAAMRPLLSALIDQTNLVWLLRYRFHQGLSAAHSYYLLIPGGGALPNELIMELAQQGGLREVVRRLPPPWQAALGDAENAQQVERALGRRTEEEAWSTLHRAQFRAARAWAYLYLREHQLWILRMALRARQLGLNRTTLARAAGFA